MPINDFDVFIVGQGDKNKKLAVLITRHSYVYVHNYVVGVISWYN